MDVKTFRAADILEDLPIGAYGPNKSISKVL